MLAQASPLFGSAVHYTAAMNDATAPPAPARIADEKRRFLFEEMDLRGELVHLDAVLSDIASIHAYPVGVQALLGEFLAASVLLASTLKFRGTLTVQARSDAQIPLIMAECSSALEVRAIARGAQEAVAEEFNELLGGGQLVLTMTPERGQRYQGIVPLQDDSLAASLDSYFAQSEQLHTRLLLFSDGDRASGLLLQQLPSQRVREQARREQQWEHINHLVSTVQPAELRDLTAETLLHRLFHEESVRLFDEEAVVFRCSCSRERTLAALATIGRDEIDDILREQGSVSMDCEFCNQRYVFGPDDLGSADGATVH